MKQLALEYADPRAGRSRKSDPRSSFDAASSCAAQKQRDQIVRLLSGALHGLTPDELGPRMHPQVHRSTVASRLAQLREDKVVEPSSLNSGGTTPKDPKGLHRESSNVQSATGPYLYE
jgi:hypothetical protein